MTYAIHEDYFKEVDKKLKGISKKCSKYGNEFKYEVKGTELRPASEDSLVYHKFIIIEVEGTAKINDWECVAVLSIHEDGNIVRKINTDIEVPSRFRTSSNTCEHCNSKRFRNNLYVIHNVETNEWKQVGGTCLKLYTGGLSLEYVAAYMDGVTELEQRNRCLGPSGSCNKFLPCKDVIGYASCIIKKLGYHNSNSEFPTSTAVKLFSGAILRECTCRGAVHELNSSLKQNSIDVEFSTSDFSYDDPTMDKIIDYYMDQSSDSEFIHNVQILLKEGFVSYKDIGYLSYLPEGYNRYLHKIFKKSETSESEHFGEVKKRYKNQKVQDIICKTSWSSIYGTQYLYNIILEDGITLTWITSSCIYLEHNESYDTIDFTVVSHEEYHGKKQTRVSRCKITKKLVEPEIELLSNATEDAVAQFLKGCE